MKVLLLSTRFWLALTSLFIGSASVAYSQNPYVTNQAGKDHFLLSASGKSTSLLVSSQDYPGVIRAAKNLQADIKLVTQTEPDFITDKITNQKTIVIAGTLGKSPLIDQLVQSHKLDVAALTGKWEMFKTQIIDNPFPNVTQALVIVGSDKRGTIYGIYDLSAQIGVSPWYWWADVPVAQKKELYILPGVHSAGEPKVKYRGIFINDEAPALSGWVKEKFGDFNHAFYEKVFELILRQKGNYLWPAMWGHAFYDDDPLNPKLADEYGVVIGTSHHEPLMRAHDEWRRYGSGKWNYQTNEAKLKNFWKSSIQRMGTNESIVSIGMRGDGDEPMTEGTAIALLEKIVADQRQIIQDVTGKQPAATPQLWALYKEVQDYYDKGMRVPDDVTLLLCDDNWGNIRKLPKLTDKPRSGGYGIYYHFDYVGGPRNYKWLNTNPIARVWEQMHLAYQYKATQIWIVNVGDIKPMEFPISFFLDYAWNPDQLPAEQLEQYTQRWAEKQFGSKYAREIASILDRYTRYNGRRKPELLSPATYSLTHYHEAENVVKAYNSLAAEAEKIYNSLPTPYKDAYYQLVLHPVKACANLNDLYVTVAKNHLYASQGRAITNKLADQAKELFTKDAEISVYYNKTLAGGKWSHMMDQTHIGYTYWQQPPRDSMPAVKTIEVPVTSEMGIAIDGSDTWWPQAKEEAVLPAYTQNSSLVPYIDVFNRGQSAFMYSVSSPVSWLSFSSAKGTITDQQRINLQVNWSKVPAGLQRIPITVTGPANSKVVVQAVIDNTPKVGKGFSDSNGYISIEAEHYSKAVGTDITWKKIPTLGRTLSGVTPFPVTASSQSPGTNSPHLEYTIHTKSAGDIKIHAYLSPTLNFTAGQGLRYAISIDDETPQILNIHMGETNHKWEQWVANNINIQVSSHQLTKPGEHVIKFWMVDPGIVLQKLVIDTGGLQSSYLGPPESSQPLK
ncbi:glycosyl hydrolase 115 family protein [Cytophagaceae bacterium YF14B1]|uniref:Glycosyl hydrolase 115 family protein n=1 Tax=Xanthocytophaga flava TaxID=3048013 RepID=A0AAE3U7A8_9BACT|nr:glycosyl hydrolase 115 family protein [Xanthocytophaga flavus]MDJ1479479.1 glycosyl hydrolase 115 family protein [Xanthocytophaga flavus]